MLELIFGIAGFGVLLVFLVLATIGAVLQLLLGLFCHAGWLLFLPLMLGVGGLALCLLLLVPIVGLPLVILGWCLYGLGLLTAALLTRLIRWLQSRNP